jgi:hypothetical protein
LPGISFASASLGDKHEITVVLYIVVSFFGSYFLAHSQNEQNAKESSTRLIIRIRTIKQLFRRE